MLKNSVQEVAGWVGLIPQLNQQVSPGLPGTHPSFSLMLDTPNNSIPLKSNDLQSNTYLAIPCKKNFNQVENIAALTPAAKSMAKKAVTSSVNATKKSLTALKSVVNMVILNKRNQSLGINDTQLQSSSPIQENDASKLPNKLDLINDSSEDTQLELTPNLEQGGYLDFKQVLTPKVVEMIPNSQLSKDVLNISKSSVFAMPLDSQWYLLNQLRIHAGAPERSDMGIEKLLNYYHQLLFLEKKFPFATDMSDIKFTWQEAFITTDKKVQTSCIQYEKAATLFNVAAILSQIAVNQKNWASEDTRTGAIYFQKAAGVLLFIRDMLCQRFTVKLEKASDLSEQSLTAFSQIMLAQASQCFLDKATFDEVNSKTLSKISAYVSDCYDLAYRESTNLNSNIIKPRLPKSWINLIKGKSLIFSAIAHFHTSPELRSDLAVAERVARLAIANEKAQSAQKIVRETSGIDSDIFQKHVESISQAYILVESANFEKHHQSSIDPRLLAALKKPKEALVRPIEISAVMGDSTRFSDILSSVRPTSTQEMIVQFLNLAAKFVESSNRDLRDCVLDIDLKLAHFNLNPDEKNELSIENYESFDYERYEENKKLAKNLVMTIKELQKEEQSIRNIDLLEDLKNIHDQTSNNLTQIFQIANDPRKDSLESSERTKIDQLHVEALDICEEVRLLRLEVRELTQLYECDISDFCVMEWSEAKLREILPCLDPNHQPDVSVHVLQQRITNVQVCKKQLLSLIDRVLEIRNECGQKLSEIARFKNDEYEELKNLDSTEVMVMISSQKEMIKSQKEQIKNLLKNKDVLIEQIKDKNLGMEQIMKGFYEVEQSRKILTSFQIACEGFSKFRKTVESEMKKSITIRSKSLQILQSLTEISRNYAALPQNLSQSIKNQQIQMLDDNFRAENDMQNPNSQSIDRLSWDVSDLTSKSSTGGDDSIEQPESDQKFENLVSRFDRLKNVEDAQDRGKIDSMLVKSPFEKLSSNRVIAAMQSVRNAAGPVNRREPQFAVKQELNSIQSNTPTDGTANVKQGPLQMQPQVNSIENELNQLNERRQPRSIPKFAPLSVSGASTESVEITNVQIPKTPEIQHANSSLPSQKSSFITAPEAPRREVSVTWAADLIDQTSMEEDGSYDPQFSESSSSYTSPSENLQNLSNDNSVQPKFRFENSQISNSVVESGTESNSGSVIIINTLGKRASSTSKSAGMNPQETSADNFNETKNSASISQWIEQQEKYNDSNGSFNLPSTQSHQQQQKIAKKPTTQKSKPVNRKPVTFIANSDHFMSASKSVTTAAEAVVAAASSATAAVNSMANVTSSVASVASAAAAAAVAASTVVRALTPDLENNKNDILKRRLKNDFQLRDSKGKKVLPGKPLSESKELEHQNARNNVSANYVLPSTVRINEEKIKYQKSPIFKYFDPTKQTSMTNSSMTAVVGEIGGEDEYSNAKLGAGKFRGRDHGKRVVSDTWSPQFSAVGKLRNDYNKIKTNSMREVMDNVIADNQNLLSHFGSSSKIA
ncbi:Rhophilin, Rho GTPase binding protein [Nowakowskiella sp. JEL0407]|nr:Rhophilin, Rho GTPase binding protein [Nowakowskiella sp. JEL0407]